MREPPFRIGPVRVVPVVDLVDLVDLVDPDVVVAWWDEWDGALEALPVPPQAAATSDTASTPATGSR